jgi:hypothetical protein
VEKKKVYTNEEAKAMRGKVAIFRDDTGREGKIYLAEVDLKIGLTCKVYKSAHDQDEGEDMICFDVVNRPNRVQEKIQNVLNGFNRGLITESDVTLTSDNTFYGNMAPCAF